MTLLPFRRHLRSFAAALLVSSALISTAFGQAAAPAPALSSAELEFADKITVASIKDMTAALSSPDMEGRGTGQPGGDKAAAWIADRYKSLGLKPLGDKGTYLQRVEFKETAATSETSFTFGDQSLAYGSDFAFVPQNNGNKNVSGDMVFVAYGIQAKQVNVDMLEGANVSGKIVVMIEGPPPGFSKEKWDEQKAQMAIFRSIVFGGAAAIVFIGQGEEKSPPEESISYLSRRQLTLPGESGYPAEVPPMIYVSASGADKLFSKSGVSRKDALAKAVLQTFKPIDLKQKAKIVGKFAVKKVAASNVVGVLEGSDPKLKAEAVVFTAHYDAYGKENGKIYHGAADNALGTAEMLAVAEAYSKASVKPKRSMIFLAVTGEEYGLYGSKHWAKESTWDIKKVAANLNLDGIGSEVYGPVKTMVGYGAEHSSLGTMLEAVARAFDVNVIPDPMPDERVFYRSDHYSMVERGIPALMLLGAPAGEKEIWMKRIKDWEKTDYHQPGDVIQPNWAWEGPERVAEIMAILGWRISETADMPAWLSTSRFAKLERGNTKELPEEK
ncbi:MAG TPA: M20/M25/M40 family metallo-hydrolase [Pyrinomonadaceae bacterium]|nr:M20/M25/M40 family metallo-hydrolase [Pyrinomonadaceae bacterium]